MTFLDVIRVPDRVTVFGEGGVLELTGCEGEWRAEDVLIEITPKGKTLPIILYAPLSEVKRVRLRWNLPRHGVQRVLGDAWERGYGDLEWRSLVPERALPWYFLAYDGAATHGAGVKTGANSLCFWQLDGDGVTLTLDVRNGGAGVQLGERRLDAATVVAREGGLGETPFKAAHAFCRSLCDAPRLPKQPVYGGNNWYYAYGHSSHAQILDDASLMASIAPDGDNRPFMVIDDGWQLSGPVVGGGPWRYSNSLFPDMERLARELQGLGTRPGLWVRPLSTTERLPESWFRRSGILDPSVPDVLELVHADIARCAGWGYDLIKHDFSTFDILNSRWGFDMGGEITPDGWHFADRSKTTAEIILGLYQTIRAAAGNALILGCNVVGHLAAGLVEVQRTGDDTSGRDWNRTRKMGVNTLAFRMPQHETFFAADADCVGLTKDIPWELNAQWLDLLARSGTPLFVSAAHEAVGPAQEKALREAFALAAQPQPAGEPQDWLDTTCPAHWRLGESDKKYNWYEAETAASFVSV